MVSAQILIIGLVAMLVTRPAHADVCISGYAKIVEFRSFIPTINECDVVRPFHNHFHGRVSFNPPVTLLQRSWDGKPLVTMVFSPDSASSGVNVVATRPGEGLKAAKAGFEVDVGRMVCEISGFRDFMSAGGAIQMQVETKTLGGGLADLSPLSSVVTSCEAP